MVSKDFCVLVLWMKVASVLEGFEVYSKQRSQVVLDATGINGLILL